LRESKAIRRVLYFGGTCEPISTAFELAVRDGYDVHCMEGVHAFRQADKRPELIKLLTKELQKVALWLTGKPVDEDRLREELKKKNAILQKIRHILALRVRNPLFLTSVPTMQILNGSSHCFGNPEGYLEMLDLIIGELEQAVKQPPSEPYIPLILAGGGAGGSAILNVIEESRGAIVGWVIVGTGEYREDIPPLESIAHYVLDAQAKGELGEGAGTSATFRKDRIASLAEETGAKGIISSAITGCPYGSIVQQIEREHFKKLGIPIISLEGTVHRGRPSEEQIMRVRTFVEMIG